MLVLWNNLIDFSIVSAMETSYWFNVVSAMEQSYWL